jgi:carbamoyl-phosphate synthase large subunit
MGVLEKYGVEMIGAKRRGHRQGRGPRAVPRGDGPIGLENPARLETSRLRCATSSTAEGDNPHSTRQPGESDRREPRRRAGQALGARQVGLPAIIRPSFTLGGTGGGIAYNREEFDEICRVAGSMPRPVASADRGILLGWKEFEMEVVRDKADNCIIICSIENVDPMGVHTGDSITVAPALTLTDKEYQIMRNASIAVLREIGVETGGSNVQFAVNPPTAAWSSSR